MVKIPEKSPNWKEIAKKNFSEILKLSKFPEIQQLIEKTDQRYYYWDKVKVQPLSKEFKIEEVWSLIRLRRDMSSNTTPLLDIKNIPFTFWLTDEIQKNLHLIDQSTGRNLSLWDPDQDKKSTDRYMTTSLIEEAITSSQIEGAVTTIKEAKKMLLDKRKPINKSEQMVFNNYQTMQSLKKYCREDLSVELLLELHRLITKDTLNSSDEEGSFRTIGDDIKVATNYGEVLFVPPPSSEINERIDALVQFANSKNNKPFVHPVIKAIMLHFWMAYIHPFTDGNGRMARTLFYWYMLKHQYWLFEFTSISKTILKRTTRYANAYLYSEHDNNDLTYFIHFHIDVIMDAVKELKEHIQKENDKNNQLRNDISLFSELNMRQTRILHHIKNHPKDILTIKNHQNLNGLSYQTARTDLLHLEAEGWLKSIKKGKTFYFVPVDDILEKFNK